MTGYVQRNEINTSFWPVRIDSTPREPGRFVIFPEPEAMPRIFSAVNISESYDHLDIFYFIEKFFHSAWKYFTTTLTLYTIFFIIFENTLSKKFFSVKHLISTCFQTWWNIFMLLIDLAPEIVSKQIVSMNVLWMTVVLGVYYGIHMILMNTLSADLSVTTEGRKIETLYDLLYDDQFKNLTPIATNFGNMLNMLERSRNGTDEKVLYERIIERNGVPNVDFFSKNMESIEEGKRIWYDLLNDKAVAIEDYTLVMSGVQHAGCHNNPSKMRELRISSQTILPGIQSHVVSFQTNREIIKLFEYRMESIIEFGMMYGYLTYCKLVNLPEQTGPLEGRGFEYEERIRKTLVRDLEQPLPDPFNLSFYRRLVYTFIVTTVIATHIMLVEIIYAERMKKGSNEVKRRRTRTIEVRVIEVKSSTGLRRRVEGRSTFTRRSSK